MEPEWRAVIWGCRLTRVGYGIGAFWRDTRGSASVEFVISLPLLIGVLVLSAEYGRAMLAREALDSATSAAVRLLSRSPADPDSSCDTDGNVVDLVLYDEFVTEARDLIAARTGLAPAAVTLSPPVITSPAPVGTFRETFFKIEVRTTARIDLPLLGLIDFYDRDSDPATPTSLTLNARDQARWVGPVPICARACTFVAQAAGECSGAS